MKKLIVLLSFVSINVFATGSGHFHQSGIDILPDDKNPQDIVKYENEEVTLSGKICEFKPSFRSKKDKCHGLIPHKYKVLASFPDQAVDISDKINLRKTRDGWFYSYTTPKLSLDNANEFSLSLVKNDYRKSYLRRVEAKLTKRIIYIKRRIEKIKDPRVKAALNRYLVFLNKVREKILAKLEKENTAIAKWQENVKVNGTANRSLFKKTSYAGLSAKIDLLNHPTYSGESLKGSISFDSRSKYSRHDRYRITLISNNKLVKEYRDIKAEDLKNTVINLNDSFSINDDLKVTVYKKLFRHIEKKVLVQNLNLYEISDTVLPTWIADDSINGSLETLRVDLKDSFGDINFSTIKATLRNENDSKDISYSIIQSGANYAQLELSIPELFNGRNYIELSAKDMAGNTGVKNIEIVADTTSPVLAFVTPLDSKQNTKQLNFEISITDESDVNTKFYVNNSLVAEGLNRKSFSALLNEGLNNIRIESVDIYGNSGIDLNHDIDVDTIAPQFTLSSIIPAYTNLTTFELVYSISDSNSYTAILVHNGTTVSLPEGTSRYTANLSEGINKFEVSLEDSFGNKSVVDLNSTTRDTLAPVIAVTSNVLDLVRTSNIDFNFSITDNNSEDYKFFLNNELTNITNPASNVIQLKEGVNTIKIEATDKANNASMLERVVTLDSIAPEIKVLSQIPSLTNNETLLVNLKITDERLKLFKAILNGTETSYSAGASKQITLTLNSGVNSLAFYAEDDAGNSVSSNAYSIVLDKMSPELASVSPEMNSIIESLGFDLILNFKEVIYDLEIDNNIVATGVNNFTHKVNEQEYGTKTYSIKFKDEAGNITSYVHNVTLKEKTVDNSLEVLASLSSPIVELNKSLKIDFSDSKSNNPIVKYSVTYDGVETTSTTPVLEITPNKVGDFDLILKIESSTGSKSLNKAVSVKPVPEAGQKATDVIAQMPEKSLEQRESEDFAQRNEFLFFGSNPIQKESNLSDTEKVNAGIVTGVVNDEDGSPLSGVRVTVLDNGKFGHTLTDVNGEFSMMIPAGQEKVVTFERVGFITSQRSVRLSTKTIGNNVSVRLVKLSQKSTEVAFSSNDSTVAFSDKVVDSRGEREVFTAFQPGTVATVVLKDGTTKNLDKGSVRFTEYTVGANGQERMPGTLPLASEYTYAFEASFDEAMALDAKSVTFNKPVYTYVTNFLNLPTGAIIPSGYYDREKGQWLPEDNGIVFKIVGKANGKAIVAATQNDAALNDSQLAQFDFTDAELTTLHDRYNVGNSFWRVPIKHFTPYDFNFAAFSIVDNEDDIPSLDNDKSDISQNVVQFNQSGLSCGSVIDVENQNLLEFIPVDGTGLSLKYESKLSSLDSTRLELDLKGNLTSISSANVVVAGKTLDGRLETIDGITKVIVDWDGKDRWGQTLYGPQNAIVNLIASEYSIGYSLCVPPNLDELFDEGNVRLGDMQSLFSVNRQVTSDECEEMGFVSTGTQSVISKTFTYNTLVDSPVKPSFMKGIKDWSLSNVHRIQYGIFFSADGQKRNGRALVPNELRTLSNHNINPRMMTYGPNGELYYYTTASKTIKRDVDGVETEVSNVQYLNSLKVGADGNLYGRSNGNLHNLSNNTIVLSSKAQNVSACDQFVHNMYKTETNEFDWELDDHKCSFPTDFAVSNDGSIYLKFTSYRLSFIGKLISNNKIRIMLGVSTVEGRTQRKVFGDWGVMSVSGKPLNENIIGINDSVEHDFNNSVYFSGQFKDTGKHSIVEVAEDVRVRRYLSGTDTNAYYVPGRFVFKNDEVGGISPVNFKADKDNIIVSMRKGLFFIDKDKEEISTISSFINTNRMVEGANIYLTGTLAENSSIAFYSKDRFIMNSSLGKTMEIVGGYGTPVMITPPSLVDLYGQNVIAVPDNERNEIYVFSRAGYHLATHFMDNKKIKYKMIYNIKNVLNSIEDQFGNTINLTYGEGGKLAKITSPGGYETNLGVRDDGKLTSVSMGSDLYLMDYGPSGLLTKFTDPLGKQASFDYSGVRLISDVNNFGNEVRISEQTRSDDKRVFYEHSALGRLTQHEHEILGEGNTHKITTYPNGVKDEAVYIKGEYENSISANGLEIEKEFKPDPHSDLNNSYISSYIKTLPDSNTYAITQERTKIENTEGVITALQTQLTENGDVWTLNNDLVQNVKTITSPEGRISKSYYNNLGNLVKQEQGLSVVTNEFNSRGQMSRSLENGNETIVTYNAKNLPNEITYNGDKTTLEYDSRGRVSKRTDENGRGVELSYDGRGNITKVTPLNGNEHGIVNNLLGLVKDYVAPGIGSDTFVTNYEYSLDNELTKVTHPSGRIVQFNYGVTTGVLNSVNTSSEDLTYGYNTAGQLDNVTSTSGTSMAIAYNGDQIKSVQSTGPVVGKVGFAYDTKQLVDKVLVNDVIVSDYSFDKDNIINSVTLSNGRNITMNIDQDYLLKSIAHGDIQESYTHDTFGRVLTYSISKNSNIIHQQSYEYAAGRVSKKTIGSSAHTYTYDKSGQILSDNTTIFSWDSNGNPTTATVDEQDRLTQMSGYTLSYDKDGNVNQVINPTLNYTLNLNVDERAILRSAEINGKQIEYVIDPSGRRIGKKVSGTLVEGFLYKDQLNPVAKLDGTGAVVQTYTYMDKSHVPAFMVANGKVYRYITDQLGSVVAVMDVETGSLVQEITYDTFGKVLSDTNPNFQPFAFAGGLYDNETKLVRFGARDYSAEFGRWLQKDPIGFGGQDTNLYRYVGNDPLNYVDHTGNFAIFILNPISISVVTKAIAYTTATIGAWYAGTWIGDVYSKSTQETVDGDFEKAQDDFLDELIAGDAKDYKISGDTIWGKTSDGRKINVRPHSSGGWPTLEIQSPSGKKHKKRYKCNGK